MLKYNKSLIYLIIQNHMGIFFKSFPAKKSAPEPSSARPEPKKTGSVSEYELKNRVNRDLSHDFNWYDRRAIGDVLSGHLDQDKGQIIHDYKKVTPDELKSAADTLKKNHGWSNDKVKKFTDAMEKQM